jgi:hypothetical protein
MRSRDNSLCVPLRKFWNLSYESGNDGGLTPLERAAGLSGIMYGRDNGDCSGGSCEECKFQRECDGDKRIAKVQESARFRLPRGVHGNVRGALPIPRGLYTTLQQCHCFYQEPFRTPSEVLDDC